MTMTTQMLKKEEKLLRLRLRLRALRQASELLLDVDRAAPPPRRRRRHYTIEKRDYCL